MFVVSDLINIVDHIIWFWFTSYSFDSRSISIHLDIYQVTNAVNWDREPCHYNITG